MYEQVLYAKVPGCHVIANQQTLFVSETSDKILSLRSRECEVVTYNAGPPGRDVNVAL